VRQSLARAAGKRVLDLAVAGGLVIALAPSMLMIAAAVKLDDRGPALFRQSRVGRHGRTFNMYKFRTMAVGSEHQHSPARGVDGQSLGPLFNVERDPRSTHLGHVLRRTGLDELPQLFNVIQGTMSLVGPRPAMPSEVIDFDEELRKRELVLPGITGLWQALARNNPSLDVYRQLDHYYMQNRTILADIAIVSLTLGQMMRRLLRCVVESPSGTL
jgi:lipopolysaccharide/colanic/teichoic acid biosynthesis glycosyltransferase